MRIGLMGGTFDPIHFGHLFIAEEARVRCALNQVLFIPNALPAHREGKSAHLDPEARLALTQLAIQSNPHFRISRIEVDRPGPSYAIDTVQQLQREFGNEAELYFILGADSLADVLTWHRGAELFDLCRFVALARPGYSFDAARRILSPQQLERVTLIDSSGLLISSRELRRRVRDGLPLRYLVPDEVQAEIERRGLYRE